MPTPLEYSNLSTGTIIHPDHISQLFPLVARLEEGLTFYRSDIGYADNYRIDCSGAGENPNQVSEYEVGQVFVFKAYETNQAQATFQVLGPEGNLDALPLTKRGGSPLSSGDIQAGEMVVVIYNDEGGGRFERIGSPVSSGEGSSSGGSSLFFFGDGSDGNELLEEDTELWEHKYYENLTIEEGVHLFTRGFKIHVSGTLTNHGIIHFNGRDALDSIGDEVGWSGGNDGGGMVAWDTAEGADGSLESGNEAPHKELGAYAASGGQGGEGAFSSGGSGEGENTFIGERYYRSFTSLMSGLSDGATHWNGPRVLRGGMGGGGGSGDGVSAAGGSGGSGAGVVWIAARYVQGYGNLEAIGGRGGAAGGTDAGGGGGGGGGVIYLLTTSAIHDFTTDVSGGTGGAGGGGSGANGDDGDDGFMIFLGSL